MKLRVKNYDIDASEPTVLLHDNDCLEIGVKENDRVSITGARNVVALVSRSDTLVEEGVVMMPAPLMTPIPSDPSARRWTARSFPRMR